MPLGTGLPLYLNQRRKWERWWMRTLRHVTAPSALANSSLGTCTVQGLLERTQPALGPYSRYT